MAGDIQFEGEFEFAVGFVAEGFEDASADVDKAAGWDVGDDETQALVFARFGFYWWDG